MLYIPGIINAPVAFAGFISLLRMKAKLQESQEVLTSMMDTLGAVQENGVLEGYTRQCLSCSYIHIGGVWLALW